MTMASEEHSLKEFKKAVLLLKRAKEKGLIRVFITLPLKIYFKVKEEKLGPLLVDFFLKEEAFKGYLDEIASILEVCLIGEYERFIRFKIEEEREEVLEELSPQEVERLKELHWEKIKTVKEHIFEPSLVEKYLLKKTTKNNLFLGFDWEIGRKFFNGSEGALKTGPYATVKVEYQEKPSQEIPPSWPYTTLEEGKRLGYAFDLDMDEIDYIVEELIKIKESLQRYKEEEDSSGPPPLPFL